MAVGQPSDPAPSRGARSGGTGACRTAASATPTRLGLLALREAIAAHYRDHYGVEVPPERIAVTTGSSAAFNLAFLAMFDVGDRVAIAAPGYPAYRNIMAALGIEVVEIEIDGAGHLTAAHVAAAHAEKPLKGVLFASPANPTGAIIPAADLEELVAVRRGSSASRSISDEIYHRLAYVSAGRDGAFVQRRRRRSSTRSRNITA